MIATYLSVKKQSPSTLTASITPFVTAWYAFLDLFCLKHAFSIHCLAITAPLGTVEDASSHAGEELGSYGTLLATEHPQVSLLPTFLAK